MSTDDYAGDERRAALEAIDNAASRTDTLWLLASLAGHIEGGLGIAYLNGQRDGLLKARDIAGRSALGGSKRADAPHE